MNDHTFNMIIVEDNKDDIQYLNKVISIDKQLNVQHISNDINEVLSYLTHKEKYAGANKLDLILLDTDISNHSGLKLLGFINNSCEFNGTPVVVLASDKHDENEVKSYQDNLYYVIRKPVSYDKLANIFKKYSLYWELVASDPHVAEQVD